MNRFSRADGSPQIPPALFAAMTGVFFLSGFAGLVYQVLWMRSLGLFFGSDMYGVSIILSTFMAGLALGSLLGGRWAERSSHPLLWYGLAELGVGSLALCFPHLLGALEPMLGAAYPETAGVPPWSYQLVRVALAAGVLLIPTTLMGTTLPLIMRHFVRSRAVVGELAAYFYAVNTFGALVGTLAAGFLLLPYLGMARATWCAVSINLAIGAVCVPLGARSPMPQAPRAAGRVDLDPIPDFGEQARRRLARAALIALGASGFGSFALEVAWTRILLISFSATVYSFASTLASFLMGICLGSWLVSRLVDRHRSPIALFAALELGVAVWMALLCLSVNAIPGFFGRLLSGISGILTGAQEHALVASTLLASLLLVGLPATLLGATFPVALRIYTTDVARIGSRTGNLYASNTLGAILGSLVSGVVLIPWLGTTASLALITALFAAIGVSLAWTGRRAGAHSLTRWRIALPVAGSLLGAGVSLLIPYRVTLNFNQRAGANAELVYHADGVQNTIDIVRSDSGVTALIIGGNVEADDGDLQRRHFTLKGHLPLMLLERPRSVLVVGLGMGITLQATARHPGVERIDVIELSPEIVKAQVHLREINGDVVRNPKVHLRIDDGRIFAKLSQNRYDMITADPVHPKISRVGYLYTREYYLAIRDHLNRGGIVCQWMPVYQISPSRLRSALKTFIDVFPNATLWYVRNHALLVARNESPLIDFDLLRKKFAHRPVRADMESIGIGSPEELLGLLWMGPDQLRAFVDAEPGVPVNTDDYPYLEYFVPGDLFYRTADNVRELARHLADPTDFVRNLPVPSAARIASLVRDRTRRIPGSGAPDPDGR